MPLNCSVIQIIRILENGSQAQVNIYVNDVGQESSDMRQWFIGGDTVTTTEK